MQHRFKSYYFHRYLMWKKKKRILNKQKNDFLLKKHFTYMKQRKKNSIYKKKILKFFYNIYIYKFILIGSSPTYKAKIKNTKNFLWYYPIFWKKLYPSFFTNYYNVFTLYKLKKIPQLKYLKNNILKIFFFKNLLNSELFFNNEIFLKNNFTHLPNFLVGIYNKILNTEYKLPLNLNYKNNEEKLNFFFKKIISSLAK